ncbi:ATP-binding protein [Streptomyces lividans]|uniref:Regulatory protein n=1 Tax=Streptomyces lividans TK24 TaxID=457428 RepID=A0ABN4DNB1_STRLI|nr:MULTISPECIES: ATP-binding protein [Streptomyces]QSJ07914.1 regulatory protein [Streptomyces lividans]AIJ12406.1 regulatory protein [Streptomyces lividans TK24]EFD65756.1 regulatory protein [Streptomyces lividans TK24]KKD11979.1 regulatory protein [Streptomyces sp. WM6391]QTD68838.1 regulatory protein [Streptomyces lividans TK24] [Streptomyces lividans]
MRPASTPRLPVTARVFVQRFSSTPRGARLARHLVVHRLDAWGVPYGSALSDTAALLVAELAANAVTHGRVPGRDIEVLLRLDAYTLRIDVSDSRGERRPTVTMVTAVPEAEHGRGLLLVEALADRWGVLDRVPVGKTVRAELDLLPRGQRSRTSDDFARE